MPRKPHPYHNLQVPRDVPFKLKPASGKGWGAFATKPIERETIILKEDPLFVIRKSHEYITDGDLWTAFQSLGSSGQHQFICLRDNAAKPFARLTDGFAENSFNISTCPQSPAHGLFLLHSRFNHSCIPNCRVPSNSGGSDSIAIHAMRDILAGEELTFCYNTDFESRTKDDRHRKLRFVCDCKACLTGTAFQQLSDMRRKFLRGLQYLLCGKDLNGERQDSTTPVIFDPKLKSAAETFSIPLSSRLIYRVLSMYLLEEEGLLDDFMVKRFNPEVMRTIASFQTESNIKFARLAMSQKTWLERFCMSLILYGREDVADQGYAMLLRTLDGIRLRNN